MLVRFLASNALQIAAPAKVNLYLELLGKRADGFHELETIMSTVSLFDQISFKVNQTGELRLDVAMADVDASQPSTFFDSLSLEPIPTDERNLILKSLRLLRGLQDDGLTDGCKLSGTGNNVAGTSTPRVISKGMDVKLLKRIPASAGLGGASSNAAAALVAGNVLWNLNLTSQQLHEAAAIIGSDVPFFLHGAMAMCRGRGEKISPIVCPAGLSIVIAKPPQGLSTPQVFDHCDLPDQSRQSEQVIRSVRSGHARQIADSMFNRLQSAAARLLDDIGWLEKEFADLPCLGHQMSGSGSSYFGVFQNQRIADVAKAQLSARWPDLKIHCVKSLGRSGALIA